MLVRSGIAQKQPVVLIFGEVASQQIHDEVDTGVDLLRGKPLGEDIGEFRFTGKLQKAGERLFVKLAGEAEAYLVWLDFYSHKAMIMRNS